MIPAAPLQGPAGRRQGHSSAHHAGEYMSEIQELARRIAAAGRGAVQRRRSGPEPLTASAHLVMAGGKRVRPLTALLVNGFAAAIDQVRCRWPPRSS